MLEEHTKRLAEIREREKQGQPCKCDVCFLLSTITTLEADRRRVEANQRDTELWDQLEQGFFKHIESPWGFVSVDGRITRDSVESAIRKNKDKEEQEVLVNARQTALARGGEGEKCP